MINEIFFVSKDNGKYYDACDIDRKLCELHNEDYNPIAWYEHYGVSWFDCLVPLLLARVPHNTIIKVLTYNWQQLVDIYDWINEHYIIDIEEDNE